MNDGKEEKRIRGVQYGIVENAEPFSYSFQGHCRENVKSC